MKLCFEGFSIMAKMWCY